MLSVVAWCKYNNIHAKFVESACEVTEKTVSLLMTCIESNNIILVEAVGIAIKDMVMAEILDERAEYWQIIIDKCRLECVKKEKQKHIRKIISVIPIGYSAIVDLQDVLNKEFGSVIYEDFDKLYEEGKTEEYLSSFVECVLAHRWKYWDDELMKWMRDVQARVLSQKKIDDEVKIRIRQIYRQISLLPNPIEAGMEYYKSCRYNDAKKSFIFSLYEGINTKTNLGYMLRRKEIDEVVIAERRYTVEELLENGVENMDPTALVNMALFLCYRDGMFDYKVGIEYLKECSQKIDIVNENVLSWWGGLAKNDLEGILVLLWLLDLDAVTEKQIGYKKIDMVNEVKSILINL